MPLYNLSSVCVPIECTRLEGKIVQPKFVNKKNKRKSDSNYIDINKKTKSESDNTLLSSNDEHISPITPIASVKPTLHVSQTIPVSQTVPLTQTVPVSQTIPMTHTVPVTQTIPVAQTVPVTQIIVDSNNPPTTQTPIQKYTEQNYITKIPTYFSTTPIPLQYNYYDYNQNFINTIPNTNIQYPVMFPYPTQTYIPQTQLYFQSYQPQYTYDKTFNPNPNEQQPQ